MTASLVAFQAACGDSIEGGTAPTIEIKDGTRTVPMNGKVSVSDLVPTNLMIENHGSGPLDISAIEVVSTPPGAFELSSQTLPLTIASGGRSELTVFFRTDLGNSESSATVTIRSNRTQSGSSAFVFTIEPIVSGPTLMPYPSSIDFQTVPALQSRTKALKLANVGSGELVVSKFFLSGHPGFSLTIGETTYQMNEQSAVEGITLPAPLTIAAGSGIDVNINYVAQGEEGAEGVATFISNDVNAPNGTPVDLFANVAAPCVRVSPGIVDFGGKAVGQQSTINVSIESCGERDLVVSEIALTDDGGGLYTIDTSALGSEDITIQPGANVQLPVTYLPAAIAPLEGGNPVRDEGEITVYSDAILDQFPVKLTGFGVDPSCPVAVITCQEGEEVAVQQLLHCSARDSESHNGITRYEWSVVQPDGSASVIQPAPDARDIIFEPNVVGTYTFKLRVYDSYNNASCADDEHTVLVTADGGIHVELLWHNGADTDETDEFGSDVDLHFKHASANGWFDPDFDCSFCNSNPEWDAFSALDNPSLDRDDVDGAGPENLNMAQPPAGNCYEIGAHYYDDWGYGAALATVRVYIYGQLRFNWDDVRLVALDMWEVGQVCWPSGDVTPYGGATPRIRANTPDGCFGGGDDLFCDNLCDEFDPFLCPSDCP